MQNRRGAISGILSLGSSEAVRPPTQAVQSLRWFPWSANDHFDGLRVTVLYWWRSFNATHVEHLESCRPTTCCSWPQVQDRLQCHDHRRVSFVYKWWPFRMFMTPSPNGGSFNLYGLPLRCSHAVVLSLAALCDRFKSCAAHSMAKILVAKYAWRPLVACLQRSAALTLHCSTIVNVLVSPYGFYQQFHLTDLAKPLVRLPQWLRPVCLAEAC